MANVSWAHKIAFLYAGSVQVKRALNSSRKDPNHTELILGYISAAVMLEAFVNFYVQTYIGSNEKLLEAFSKMTFHQRVIFLPRFCLGATPAVSKYEKDPVHEAYKPIITYRNQLAHGDLKKINLGSLSTKQLDHLWNQVVDLFLLLVSTITSEPLASMKGSPNSFERLKFKHSKTGYSSKFLDDFR